MSKQKGNVPLKNWAKFSTIALQMGATIYGGNIIGRWLDSTLETTFLESVLTMVAVLLSMYIIIKSVMNLSK